MANREGRRQQKKEKSAVVLKITIDGEDYRFDTSTITYPVELELFNATKLTMSSIFQAIEDENVAPFMIAALVFLARRSGGDKIKFGKVAEAINYDSEMEVEILGGEDQDEDEAGEQPPEDRAAG